MMKTSNKRIRTVRYGPHVTPWVTSMLLITLLVCTAAANPRVRSAAATEEARTAAETAAKAHIYVTELRSRLAVSLSQEKDALFGSLDNEPGHHNATTDASSLKRAAKKVDRLMRDVADAEDMHETARQHAADTYLAARSHLRSPARHVAQRRPRAGNAPARQTPSVKPLTNPQLAVERRIRALEKNRKSLHKLRAAILGRTRTSRSSAERRRLMQELTDVEKRISKVGRKLQGRYGQREKLKRDPVTVDHDFTKRRAPGPSRRPVAKESLPEAGGPAAAGRIAVPPATDNAPTSAAGTPAAVSAEKSIFAKAGSFFAALVPFRDRHLQPSATVPPATAPERVPSADRRTLAAHSKSLQTRTKANLHAAKGAMQLAKRRARQTRKSIGKLEKQYDQLLSAQKQAAIDLAILLERARFVRGPRERQRLVKLLTVTERTAEAADRRVAICSQRRERGRQAQVEDAVRIETARTAVQHARRAYRKARADYATAKHGRHQFNTSGFQPTTVNDAL